ncbi:MAG TPA: Calx-beta domain-containing protein [Thermoanaerobaculia bacterium]
MRKLLQTAGLVAWVLFATAAARAQYDDPPDPPPGQQCASGDVQVNTQSNNTWSQTQVNLDVGQTLCVRNNSGIPHNFHVLGVVRCAGTCSANTSSSTTTPRGDWVSRLSFSSPGTLNFRCDEHGTMGMTGTLVVQGATADAPGSLSFTVSNFSVSEAGPNATITARRTGGDDGAVSVQYATANGSATAGSDYTAKTGTLSWPDNDDNNKTFTVAITNDTADEANETVLLSLSNPTGGATLGSPAAATLTINDNDDGGGGTTAPAAPSNLKARGVSTTAIDLTWKDNANNETQVLIERRPLQGGTFVQVGTAAANATAFTAGGLTPEAAYEFRVRAANSGGNSAYSNVADGSTDTEDTGPCLEGTNALCVTNERFKIEVDFATGQSSGPATAVPVPTAPASGLFYFFGADNIELLIKVLNACAFNRYWVFFAATTNVEFTVVVTDTQTSRTRFYFNPLNRPAPPIQDTDAFATCP